MLGFGATGQFAIGQVDTGGAAGAEFIGPDKYMQRLGEPVRARPRSPAAMSPFFFMDPQPFVSFSWFDGLAEPVRRRPRSPAAMAPVHFMQPTPVVSFSWFDALAEPVRRRPALKAGENPSFFWQPTPSPFAASGWFSALSEPVRFKIGLKPWLQQFFTAPPRLLPNPTLFGTLSALETKDVFLAGASAFNPAASAEIGIVDTGFPDAGIGIAVPAVASVRISVQII